MTERFDIRAVRESELEQAIALADRVFRADLRRSMASSLPRVFSPSLLHSIGAFLDGRLVSFAGLVPSVVRIGAARVTLLSYGAVCTDEGYRGRGLASRILHYAQAYAREADVSLLLVSGELALYLQAGFRPYGESLRCVLRRSPAREAANDAMAAVDPLTGSELRVESASSQDSLRLYRLAAARSVAYDQSVWDLADLLRAGSIAAIRDWRQDAYLVWRQGEAIAMLVLAYGQAADGERRGQAIEWAGSWEAVVSAAEALLWRLDLAEITLHAAGSLRASVSPGDGGSSVPEQGERSAVSSPAEVAMRMGRADAVAEISPGLCAASIDVSVCRNDGTLLVSRPDLLFRELEPYWSGLGLGSEALPRLEMQPGGRFVVRIGDTATPPLSQEELSRLLFGCAGEPSPVALQRLGETATACFPVPLPYMKGLNFV